MARDFGYEMVLIVPKTLDETFSQDTLEQWYPREGYTPLENSANGAIVKRLTNEKQ